MTATTSNPYLRTKVLTANPGELRLMLIEGAVKFCEQGRQGLERRDYEAAYNGISRCQAILMELISNLRPEHDPKLCEQLTSLYTWMYTRLIAALSERDGAIAAEVLEVLHYERETWSMVLAKLAEENTAAGCLDQAPDAAPLIPPGDDATAHGLVGGQVNTWRG